MKFGPAEYFSLMVLGLVASIVLAHGSLLHALGMILLGLFLGLIGTDVNSGTARYTFDLPELADGINFVIVAMGVFGIGEIIANLEHETTRTVVLKSVTGLMPTREDLKRMAARSCAGRPSDPCSASFPAAAPCWPPSQPTPWRRRSRARRPVRQGRHRGRGRAGERQQRRRADLVHSDADAGHPVESRSWP